MKIRRYHPIALLAAAALGSGCARMTALQEPEPVAIAFSVSAGDYLATRAEGEIPTDEVLRAGSGFGVFACYTGAHKYSESSVSPDFMYNQKVTYNPGIPAWEYSPVKYWPNGEGEPVGETGENPHYVSFFAYAPYSDGTSQPCIPSFSLPYEQSNPWLIYRLADDPAQQVDLLYAEPMLDQTKGKTGDRLEFTFRHALGCIGDAVRVECSDELTAQLDAQYVSENFENLELLLTELSVEYTLTQKGRLVLWTQGGANWQPVLSEEPIVTRAVNLLDADCALYSRDGVTPAVQGWQNTGEGIFFIPLDLEEHPQQAVLNLTYSVRSTKGGVTSVSTYSREKTLLLKDYYDDGVRTNIHITLDKNNP